MLQAPRKDRVAVAPTGMPTWPVTLIAGVNGFGKTYKLIEASSSPLVGGAYVIEFGERGTANYYGAIPNTRFKIVPQDGSYMDLLDACRWGVAQPRMDPAKPNLLLFDGATELWALLSAEQQLVANERHVRKAAYAQQKGWKSPRPLGVDEEAQVTSDLWNAAKDRWRAVIDTLRAHDGPVIIACQLNEVAVMDGAGQPTKEKRWKEAVEKNTTTAMDCVVHLREYRTGLLVKATSLVLAVEPGQMLDLGDFTMDELWRMLGITEDTVLAPRVHVATNAAAYLDEGSEDAPALTGEQLIAEIVATQTAADRHAALVAVGRKYGREVLDQVRTVAPNGEPVTGTQLVSGWIAKLTAPPAPAAPAAAPAAQPEPQQPETQTESRPEPQQPETPAASVAEAVGKAAQTAPATAAAETEGEKVKRMAEYELDLACEHLGVDRADLLTECKEWADADDVKDLVPAVVLGFLARKVRRRVIAAAKDAGDVSLAKILTGIKERSNVDLEPLIVAANTAPPKSPANGAAA